MARALFARHAPHDACDSAGLRPGSGIHPLVVEAMREVGLDLSRARPKALTLAQVTSADLVVRCLAPDPDDFPWPPGARVIDWVLPMPDDEDRPTLEEIRRLRDAIDVRVRDLTAVSSGPTRAR